MTTITSQASSTFIKSKKHTRPSAPIMSAPALAVLATLAMPLGVHASGVAPAAPELVDGATLPKVHVTGGN
ncbi:MAG: hypothetical protein EOP92_22590, partial [Lysobacteraceae bacterium]